MQMMNNVLADMRSPNNNLAYFLAYSLIACFLVIHALADTGSCYSTYARMVNEAVGG